MPLVPGTPGSPEDKDISFKAPSESSAGFLTPELEDYFLVAAMEHYLENPKLPAFTDFDEQAIEDWAEKIRETLGQDKLPETLDDQTRATIRQEMVRINELAYSSSHEIFISDKMMDKRNAALKKAEKLQAEGKLPREERVAREENIRRALEIACEMIPAVNPKRHPASLVEERRAIVQKFVSTIIEMSDQESRALPLFYYLGDDEEKKRFKAIAREIAAGTQMAKFM